MDIYFYSILLILIILIIILTTNNTHHNFEKYDLQKYDLEKYDNTINDFIYITYETDKNNTNLNFLLFLINKYKYPNYKVLGVGETWNDWYGRLTSYKNFIESINLEKFVLITDARDVLVNEPYEDFIKKAKKLYYDNNSRVICGAEQVCCTADHNGTARSKNIDINIKDYIKDVYKPFMEAKGKDNFYKYIQFGLLFGKAKDLLNLFKAMDLKPGGDDQTTLYKTFYENPDILTIDYSGIIFSNAPNLKKIPIVGTCFYKWDYDNKSFRNTKTNNIPSLIQTPGQYWNCYYFLLKKLIS